MAENEKLGSELVAAHDKAAALERVAEGLRDDFDKATRLFNTADAAAARLQEQLDAEMKVGCNAALHNSF